jgi:hypothetical protein
MSRIVPAAQPKMPWWLIILICVIMALLLGLAILIELARGFHEGFYGL